MLGLRKRQTTFLESLDGKYSTMEISRLGDKQKANMSTVFLTRSLARAFVKQCILTGAFKLAIPQNSCEAEQVLSFKKGVNKARCDFTTLMYALMFDKVIIDESAIEWNHLFESPFDDDDDYPASRPLIESFLPGITQWLSIEDPGIEYNVPHSFPLDVNTPLLRGIEASDEEHATLMSLIEPILWHRLKPYSMTRDILRDVLDLLVQRPEIISISRWHTDEQEIPIDSLSPLFSKYTHDERTTEYFRSVIHITRVKSEVALGELRMAIKHSAVMPIPSLTFGKNRDLPKYFNLVQKDNLTVGLKLFLDGIEYWPMMRSLNDVFRLREKPYIQEFRDFLRQWVYAIEIGDKQEELKLRSEIKAANNSLKRITKCTRIGKIMVYISIPFMILDSVWLSVFGPSLSMAGFGLQLYADRLMGKHRWIAICT